MSRHVTPMCHVKSLHMLQADPIICYQTDPTMKAIDSECTVSWGVVWQGLLGPCESSIQMQLILWRERTHCNVLQWEGWPPFNHTGARLKTHATQVSLSKISAVSQLHNSIQYISVCIVCVGKITEWMTAVMSQYRGRILQSCGCQPFSFSLFPTNKDVHVSLLRLFLQWKWGLKG